MKEKQTKKKDRNKEVNQAYSDKVRAKWFCCVFKVFSN